jgi:hypothetical protein
MPPVAARHRKTPNARARSLGALLVYAAGSVVLFGLPVLRHPSRVYVGYGTDPATHMWFLVWWPHAISHGLDPFFTHALWAPTGYHLGAVPSIPGPSLLLAPITLALGPIVAYNILALCCPAVSAWTAYLLCRRVTGSHAASLVGGWLFGFSTYELGQLMGHPNLALAALVPVIVLLAFRRVDGSLRPWTFVVLLALCVGLQLLVSAEVLLTLAVFGGLALVLAAVSFSRRRTVIASTLAESMVAIVIACIVLLPYLLAVIRDLASPPIYTFYSSFYTSDLKNFLIPNPMTLLGGSHYASIAATFSGNVSEQMAYLGLPLIAALLAFAVSWRRRRVAWFLLGVLLMVLVATLGPRLRVGGVESVWLPWRLVVGLPFLRFALPSRFMLYAFLAAAVIVSLWLADARGATWSRRARWALALLALVALLPVRGRDFWKWPDDTPAFFSTGMYRTYLAPGENALLIPFGGFGTSMLWQAETGFAFRMPEGYVSVVPPPEFAGDPFLQTLSAGVPVPASSAFLDAFLRAHDVGAVVVKAGTPGSWRQVFGPLDPSPVEIGGVVLYRVGPSG